MWGHFVRLKAFLQVKSIVHVNVKDNYEINYLSDDKILDKKKPSPRLGFLKTYRLVCHYRRIRYDNCATRC